jgi:hypothetical protein
MFADSDYYTKFNCDVIIGEKTTETITLNRAGDITCRIVNNGDIYFANSEYTFHQDRIEDSYCVSRTYEQIIEGPPELINQYVV